mmetsp:Transcript_3590/g.11182  ORF Transcript_3590/g.11182 Transcript_3590/m.11182 type:complete len:251 (-) Transcript_3590:751-1503(-)
MACAGRPKRKKLRGVKPARRLIAALEGVPKGVLSTMLQVITARRKKPSGDKLLSFLATSIARGAIMSPAAALERQFAMTWATRANAQSFVRRPPALPKESIMPATAYATPVFLKASEMPSPAPMVRSSGQLRKRGSWATCTALKRKSRTTATSVPRTRGNLQRSAKATETSKAPMATIPRHLSNFLPWRGAWEFGTSEVTRKLWAVCGRPGNSSKASMSTTSPGARTSQESDRGTARRPLRPARRQPASG